MNGAWWWPKEARVRVTDLAARLAAAEARAPTMDALSMSDPGVPPCTCHTSPDLAARLAAEGALADLIEVIRETCQPRSLLSDAADKAAARAALRPRGDDMIHQPERRRAAPRDA